MSDVNNVNSVFTLHCKHLKFDQHLAKKVLQYKNEFEFKNEEHTVFFGAGLIGVQVVRFTNQDKDNWFNDVLKVNDIELEDKVLQLPTINANFHISSDLFNLSVVWMMHQFHISPYLKEDQKQQAILNTAICMNYKFLTSLLFRYFKYPADPEMAKAAYAQLSYKYAIKQHGNWRDTIAARCKDLIDVKSIHYKVLEKCNDDFDIVYLLNDSQGRIRDMIKNIYNELMKVKNNGFKIATTSNTAIDHDGEEIMKDKSKSMLAYTRYINSIITDKNAFIKPELQLIIENVCHTMPPKLLTTTLEYCTDGFSNQHANDIDELIKNTLTHSFNYFSDNRNVLKDKTDLTGLISRMRGVYMSSRSTEVELMRIRDLGEKIVKSATKIKNTSVIASVRTGLLLYILLRAYTMHHYS